MEKERAGIQSVEVGFTLIEALAQASGPLMLKDVAAAAGMSAAKAHRYLVSFQRIGMVNQDPRNSRYDLGPFALKVGLAALSRLDPVRVVRERIPELIDTLHHTLAIAVWGNHGPTIVHWEESTQPIAANLRLGDVMPILSSATGRCFGAWLPREVTSPLLDPEIARARKAKRLDLPHTPEAVAAMLAEVRERGSARVVNSMLPGIAAICAPVFDASGHMVMGLMSLGSLATFDSEYGGAIDAPLQAAALQISNDLGWRAKDSAE